MYLLSAVRLYPLDLSCISPKTEIINLPPSVIDVGITIYRNKEFLRILELK